MRNVSNHLFISKFDNTGVLYDSLETSGTKLNFVSGFLVDARKNLLAYGTGPSHIACIDTLGYVLWHKHISFSDTTVVTDGMVSAVEDVDGGFVMTTWGVLSNHINTILKTDSAGNLKWWNELPGGSHSITMDFSQNNLAPNNHGFCVGLVKGRRTIGIAKTDTNGIITDLEINKIEVARKYLLFPNYPNPFNGRTIISFELPSSGIVELSVFNILGELVQTIFYNKLNAGFHEVEWDAAAFPSGIYFVRLNVDKKYSLYSKSILMK